MNRKEQELESLESFLGFLDTLFQLDELDKVEHKHKCGTCGFVWHHIREDIREEYYQLAHTCLQCGAEQRYKYDGDESSKCLYDGMKTEFTL